MAPAVGNHAASPNLAIQPTISHGGRDMQLKPGTRLESQTCDAQVIVVRAPAADIDLRCGGEPLVAVGSGGQKQSIAPAHEAGTLMGKRYADEETGIEVLCTKPGKGSLSIGDTALPAKDAKPLPSSD